MATTGSEERRRKARRVNRLTLEEPDPRLRVEAIEELSREIIKTTLSVAARLPALLTCARATVDRTIALAVVKALGPEEEETWPSCFEMTDKIAAMNAIKHRKPDTFTVHGKLGTVQRQTDGQYRATRRDGSTHPERFNRECEAWRWLAEDQ